MSLHHVDPAHQNEASRRPGPAPRLASQQRYPVQPQPSSWVSIASAPFSNHLSVPSPSQYTPYINPQDLALSPQHYAGSQAVPQRSRSSHLLTAPTPDDHSVTHHGYRERDVTTPSRRVGGPLSDGELGSHNRSDSGRNPIDDLSCQNVQGALMGPYNPGFGEVGNIEAQQHRSKQSIKNQTDASRGIYPGMSSLDDHFGLNAGGDIGNQGSYWATSQWSDSQEIGNQATPSTNPMPGLDPSLVDGSVLEKYRSFSRDIEQIDSGGSDVQNGWHQRNPADLDDRFPDGPPTSTLFRCDTVSTATLPPTASNVSRSRPRHRRHSRRPFSSGSSKTTCKTCDDDPYCEHKPAYGGKAESQKTSLAKHMREKHSDSQHWSYKCSLDKDGSACSAVIDLERGRRKHVETVHPSVSREELPPTDKDMRRANPKTKEMLERWFAKIPRTDSH